LQHARTHGSDQEDVIEQVSKFVDVATGTNKIVSIRRTDLWINVTNILKQAGLDDKRARQRVWSDLRERGFPMERVQGTDHPGMYMPYEEGLKLCDWYELSPLKEPLRKAKECLTLKTTGSHRVEGDHQLEMADIRYREVEEEADEDEADQEDQADQEEEPYETLEASDSFHAADEIAAFGLGGMAALEVVDAGHQGYLEKPNFIEDAAKRDVAYEGGEDASLPLTPISTRTRRQLKRPCHETSTPAIQRKRTSRQGHVQDGKDGGQSVYIIIRTGTGDNIVSIRRTDLWINATDILKEAGVDRNRTHIFTAMRKTGVRMERERGSKRQQGAKHQGMYMPYREGLKLCKKYRLKGLLQTLREAGEDLNIAYEEEDACEEDDVCEEEDATREATCYFTILTSTGNTISIHSPDFWINGTNILEEAGLDLKARERVWGNLWKCGIPMECHVEGTSYPGMYMPFEEGLRLCDKYRELAPLKELLQRTKVEEEEDNEEDDNEEDDNEEDDTEEDDTEEDDYETSDGDSAATALESSRFARGNFSSGSFLSQSSLSGSESNCVTYRTGLLGILYDSSFWREDVIT
jgi:hypothetical protein